ncbi:MAG: hypothetical protein EZS28_012110 [Streblomastix strix]|uniref:Uncharacterized protein n=1 Tax=Streblomastix strix TaxID=222440 RepID=A0A5J4WCH2_9EUKA|nr:MAG: hypothetical protein EZS28_012110 [Streblomastix strix]
MILLLPYGSCISHQFITKTGLCLQSVWYQNILQIFVIFENVTIFKFPLQWVEKGNLTQINYYPHYLSSRLATTGPPPDPPRFIEQFTIVVAVQAGTIPVYSISC